MLVFCGLSSANRIFLWYNRIMIRAADKPETAEKGIKMTNAQIKDRAHVLFTKHTGIKVAKKSIVLLEADTDGSYIFFRVGKLSFAWYSLLNAFCAYPDVRGIDGMKIGM